MGGFWSLLIDIRIWLYGLPFLLRVIYIINIFVFFWAIELLGDFVLWIYGWGFFLFWGFSWVFWAMGLGVLGFCGRKLYISI